MIRNIIKAAVDSERVKAHSPRDNARGAGQGTALGRIRDPDIDYPSDEILKRQ